MMSRLASIVIVASVVIAACGGGSDDAESGGSARSAEPEFVLDSAVPVASAVVESTTTSTSTTTTTTSTTTTTVAPDTTVAPTADGVPAGFIAIINDSGDLQANVPAEWSDIAGAPDGPLEQLAAGPDLQAFLASYAEPGMALVSGDAPTPDAWIDGLATTIAIAENDGCTISDTADYDDGVYTGTEHLLTCGDPSTVAHIIGGRNLAGDQFFLLAIVIPVDAPEIRTQIIQSFYID